EELPALLPIPDPAAEAGRGLQPEVEADVEDHAARSQALRIEHAQVVAGVIEEPEISHEPLRVQRPALTVPGHPAHEAAPAIEGVGDIGGLTDLQVMAGHSLVVDRRLLLPGGELVHALRHRPPHAT